MNIKQMIFGRGEITDRLKLIDWYIAVEWILQDFWIGAFWKRKGHCLDIWICVVPCIPFHFCFMWHDPEQ